MRSSTAAALSSLNQAGSVALGVHRVDITGRGGVGLGAKWAAGPRTYLGLQVQPPPRPFVDGPRRALLEHSVPCPSRCVRASRDARSGRT